MNKETVVKYDVVMLARSKKMNIDELADACNISRGHLRQVSAGNVQMTAKDLIALADFTGVDPRKIAY